MSKQVRILRVDPGRKAVATMFLKGVRDATPQIRRLVRANNIGSRQLLEIDGVPLMCIAGLDVDEAMKGWRLRGGDDTGGVAILTGRDVAKDLIIDVPVSRGWLFERLEWLDGEDVGAREARAEEIVPALNADIRQALAEAVVVPGGEIWLSAAHKAVVGEAMVTLGLGTERSGGQMLTKLGESVFDLIGQPVDGPETRGNEQCRVCQAPIGSAELCETCAAGNDPFAQAKHEGGRP